jgi:sodium/bile acid cotransporter 7
MKSFLARRWFLLLLAAGVGLAAARPGWLRPLTEGLPVRSVVAPALFLMAWGLDSRALFRSLARPWPALWAVLISYGAVPLFGWLAGHLLSEPDYRVGLLIISCVPCTLASAVLWTRMGRGNEAVALLVIFLTTGTSWLFTTAWLTALTRTAVSVDAPRMMGELLLVLVVPVAGGQLLRLIPLMAELATRRKTILGAVAQLFVLVIILKAAVDVFARLGERTSALAAGPLLAAAAACLVVHLAGLAVGFWSSRGLRFDRPSQVAVAFACSQKTLPVALFLFETYFRGAHPLAVVPLVVYHVGQLIVDTFIADAMARTEPPAA